MEQVIPNKQGQIVRIFNPLPGENPETEYIVAEDPNPYDNKGKILLYPVSEIQRVATKGGIPFSDSIQKGDLTVIGESMEEWIDSWNKNDDLILI